MKCRKCNQKLSFKAVFSTLSYDFLCKECLEINKIPLSKSLMLSLLSGLFIAVFGLMAGLSSDIVLFIAIFGGGVIARLFLFIKS